MVTSQPTFSVHEKGTSHSADSPWLLRRLLEEHFANLRSSIFANAFNAAILLFTFWNSAPKSLLLIGVVTLLPILAWRVLIARRMSNTQHENNHLLEICHSIEMNALTLGSWWGFTIMYLLQLASPTQQLLVAVVGAGMPSAGTITFRTLGRAARLFIGSCGFGAMLALLLQASGPALASAALLVCYMLVLFASVGTGAHNAVMRNLREAELQKSSDTINMLLADFTEQGSDWLIELDRHGNIANPSERFAEAAQRPAETITGISFLSLLDDNIETQELADHLSCRRAFRNQNVTLTIGNKNLCWSISARPSVDSEIAFRGVVSDISAQRQAEERVSYMAHFDALTDLPNRFLFNQRLIQSLHNDDKRAALLYLDLDHFKAVNDTLGHVVGDQLLKAVAVRLTNCIGHQDVVARLGGDEFAVIASGNRTDNIKDIAEAIIEALALPFSIDGHDVVIGTSIGIALAPEHGADGTTLLRNADLALYAAKTQGRNRQAMFEQGMDEAAQSRRELEQDLRNALARDQLCLHYQPLVQIDDGNVLGYEALIRWEHPIRGVVMPDAFIPIAEDSGMIIQIGEWVIRQALDDLAQWPKDKGVSINLSPVQMRSPSLISTLVNALARTGVKPSRICFEITETVLMHDSDANLQTLHKLRDIGVEIALDDFGTGYSSLNYLRSFPFDKIKIDRCFISEIDSREDCRAIVRSVVNLANSLGMTTTAEGVEREDQVRYLRDEGCAEVQGYLFSKAVPQDQLTDLRKPIHSHARRLVEMEQERVRLSKPTASAQEKAA
jgi:diguanylate cyclase (GGDEF)-like protein